jgi:polyhydroxyalkanoate synthesis regulator phasin
MLELLRKTALMSMGLATVTNERIKEIANKISEDAKLTAEESKQLADQLMNDAAEAKSRYEEQLIASVRSAIDDVNIATKNDIERLEKKIDNLKTNSDT